MDPHDLEVIELAPADTHPLRRRVLRDGSLTAEVVFDGDSVGTTLHLGVRIDGDVVAISTWLLRAYPDRPAETGYQLRGMATAPEYAGAGLGSLVLSAGQARCQGAGASLVWARARDTALGFYVRHGFVTAGVGYVDLTTGLPHHDVIKQLD